jgi:radical SAM protein with 4Fe4S-binding SPASM domain
LTERAQDERPGLRIGMNTVISKQNINELGDIVRLAADSGVRMVNFLDPVPVDEITVVSIPSEVEFAAIHIKEISALARSLGLGISWQIRQRREPSSGIGRCLHPWKTIFVRANGSVQPCMALFGTDKAAVMGNIFQEDFEEIWNGDQYREYRRTKRRGTNTLCRVCPYR